MPKKVLIVEDDITMREILVSKLSSAGFVVVEAEDGKHAVATWQKEKPDLVLLDLMLPEADGFSVLGEIRKNPDTSLANTKVIILSNLWSKSDIERAKNLTIEEFLVKAYHTTEEILDEVKKVLYK